MDIVFLICVVLGATLLILEIGIGLFGFGTDHDIDTDGEPSNTFFSMLSVRTATVGLLFFGLGGRCAQYYNADELPALGIAIGSGGLAFYLVAIAMRSLTKLKSDGTVRIDRAIGCTGTVYLRIPGRRTGTGKVHLSLQNRTVEYPAVTAGEELPTGQPVRVVAVINADTVEVEPV